MFLAFKFFGLLISFKLNSKLNEMKNIKCSKIKIGIKIDSNKLVILVQLILNIVLK
jgi:hypothetical protein